MALKKLFNNLIISICLLSCLICKVKAETEVIKPEAIQLYTYFLKNFKLSPLIDNTVNSFSGNITGSFDVNGDINLNGSTLFNTSGNIKCYDTHSYEDVGDTIFYKNCVVNLENEKNGDNRLAFVNFKGRPNENITGTIANNVYLDDGMMSVTSDSKHVNAYEDDNGWYALYAYELKPFYISFISTFALTDNLLKVYTPKNSKAKIRTKKISVFQYGTIYKYTIELKFDMGTYFKFDLPFNKDHKLLPLYSGYGYDLPEDMQIYYGVLDLGNLNERQEDKVKEVTSGLNHLNGTFAMNMFQLGNLEAVDVSSKVDNFISNSNFISSMTFVGTIFNRIIDGTPFQMLLVYSLSIGLVLTIVGRLKR